MNARRYRGIERQQNRFSDEECHTVLKAKNTMDYIINKVHENGHFRGSYVICEGVRQPDSEGRKGVVIKFRREDMPQCMVLLGLPIEESTYKHMMVQDEYARNACEKFRARGHLNMDDAEVKHVIESWFTGDDNVHVPIATNGEPIQLLMRISRLEQEAIIANDVTAKNILLKLKTI